MRPRHKKLIAIVASVVMLCVAALLVLNAFRANLVYFFSPSEVLEGKAPKGGVIRIGGLVEKDSVRKDPGGLKVEFTVTDYAKTLPVRYQGILPDLFREGQGVVVQGRLSEGVFVADQVLAKHDENYMPPEVAQSLKPEQAAKTLKIETPGATRNPAPAGGKAGEAGGPDVLKGGY